MNLCQVEIILGNNEAYKDRNDIQSHPKRRYRWLSHAALTCLLAGKWAIILMLLPNTHSVISVYVPSRWSRASMYICKVKTLAFTDCDYCYTLVL